MKRITPNISVENCKEAIEFYKEVFGGEIKNTQLADGKEMFEGLEGKIIHSELHINSDCLMYFQDFLGEKKEGKSVGMILEMDSEDEINRVYAELSQNGSIQYDLQKTFWGAYHAVLTDRFGCTWSLNYTSR